MRLPLQTPQAPDSRVPLITSNNGFGGVRHGFNSRQNHGMQPHMPSFLDSSREDYFTPSSFPGTMIQPYTRPSFELLPSPRLPLISEVGRNHDSSRDPAAMDLCNKTPIPPHLPSFMIGDSASSATLSNGTLTGGNWASYDQNNETPTQTPRAVEAYKHNIAGRYSRVTVRELLNPLESNQTPTQSNSDNAASTSQAGPSTLPPPAYSTSSFCSCTTTTSSNPTLSLSGPIEEHAYLISTLYYTCVDATTSYITSLPPLTRHRQQIRHRFHPYSRSHSTVSRNRNENTGSPTLMDNISSISSHLWRKARSDAMAPHREEADAVAVMGDLYSWGEMIARGMQGWDSVFDEGWDVIAGLEGVQRDTEIAMRVGRAAKSLCEFLGDGDGWANCDEIMGDLEALRRAEESSGVRSGERVALVEEVEDEEDEEDNIL